MKAEYPNQLDYNGLNEITKAFVIAKQRYSIMGELLNMSNGVWLSYITPFSENIHPLRLVIEKCIDINNTHVNFNTGENLFDRYLQQPFIFPEHMLLLF